MSASVQHVRVERTKDGYKFGQVSFDSIKEMKKHFEIEKPVIGGDSGLCMCMCVCVCVCLSLSLCDACTNVSRCLYACVCMCMCESVHVCYCVPKLCEIL